LSVHIAEIAYSFGSALFARIASSVQPGAMDADWEVVLPACEPRRLRSAQMAAGAADWGGVRDRGANEVKKHVPGR
jgi:hypothetical protein